jgi:hypothetical protein
MSFTLQHKIRDAVNYLLHCTRYRFQTILNEPEATHGFMLKVVSAYLKTMDVMDMYNIECHDFINNSSHWQMLHDSLPMLEFKLKLLDGDVFVDVIAICLCLETIFNVVHNETHNEYVPC